MAVTGKNVSLKASKEQQLIFVLFLPALPPASAERFPEPLAEILDRRPEFEFQIVMKVLVSLRVLNASEWQQDAGIWVSPGLLKASVGPLGSTGRWSGFSFGLLR